VTSFALNIWSDTITITNTFSASDVLVIDCEDKTVKLNWIAIDYSGVFPILEVGVNSYTITINWTKNFDITLSYFNNFL
jgi:phage-related protein